LLTCRPRPDRPGSASPTRADGKSAQGKKHVSYWLNRSLPVYVLLVDLGTEAIHVRPGVLGEPVRNTGQSQRLAVIKALALALLALTSRLTGWRPPPGKS